MRQAIKEVWIELKPSSKVSGEVGVFVVRDIGKGQKVCLSESAEEDFITREEFASLSPEMQSRIRRFTAGRPDGFLMEAGVDFNDLGVSYFFNHSCEGNLGFDQAGDFVAIRDISKGEELLYDYGLLEADPEFKFDCQCGEVSCRQQVTGLDWCNPKFQEKNYEYIYPDLRLPIK